MPPGDFWSGYTLEDLARMQNVRPVERLEDLIGGWPVEELQDGFEEGASSLAAAVETSQPVSARRRQSATVGTSPRRAYRSGGHAIR